MAQQYPLIQAIFFKLTTQEFLKKLEFFLENDKNLTAKSYLIYVYIDDKMWAHYLI
jgi:hypothetical protein